MAVHSLPNQLTVSHTNKAVHENFIQTIFYILSGNALFQDHLKETTSAGSTHKPAVDQFLNAAENLFNQRIAASGIYLLAELPVSF